MADLLEKKLKELKHFKESKKQMEKDKDETVNEIIAECDRILIDEQLLADGVFSYHPKIPGINVSIAGALAMDFRRFDNERLKSVLDTLAEIGCSLKLCGEVDEVDRGKYWSSRKYISLSHRMFGYLVLKLSDVDKWDHREFGSICVKYGVKFSVKALFDDIKRLELEGDKGYDVRDLRKLYDFLLMTSRVIEFPQGRYFPVHEEVCAEWIHEIFMDSIKERGWETSDIKKFFLTFDMLDSREKFTFLDIGRAVMKRLIEYGGILQRVEKDERERT